MLIITIFFCLGINNVEWFPQFFFLKRSFSESSQKFSEKHYLFKMSILTIELIIDLLLILILCITFLLHLTKWSVKSSDLFYTTAHYYYFFLCLLLININLVITSFLQNLFSCFQLSSVWLLLLIHFPLFVASVLLTRACFFLCII